MDAIETYERVASCLELALQNNVAMIYSVYPDTNLAEC